MASHLTIESFFDPITNTVTYLAWDEETRKAAIIDAVLDFDPAPGRLSTGSADKVLARVEALGLKLDWALETHAHADHISAAHYVREKTGAKIAIGAHITDVQKTFAPLFNARDLNTDGSDFDVLLRDGETFEIGGLKVRVMHTPGHTPACVTYVVEDAAFVGDTLFMPDYGTARADFPGGDAGALYRSIRKILDLPVETRIFVGHDYMPEGRSEPAWETTVAEQRKNNVYIRDGVSEHEFVERRRARDKTLATPRLIMPSLQVNIHAGAMPEPEDNGLVYLRTPINALGALKG